MTTSHSSIRFEGAISIFRIFDEAKAREFYIDYLGFKVRMEHRFEPSLPLYMGIERDGLEIHLSEHHGDACPGSTTFVWMHGVRALHDELKAKQYKNIRPAVEKMPWGEQLEVFDPFGNRIRFCERT